MNHTDKLKSALWRGYGNPEYPSEWDGKVYGGGKLSQRFWEYHQAIELLELTPDSVVLDIGGGSPATGAGFFTRVMAPHVKAVHVMDENIGQSKDAASNIVFHRSLANYETLSKLMTENLQISHVSCISVFEHIPQPVRCGMIRAVNEFFLGDTFVSTLEYHARDRFFEHQLTTATLSEMFGEFTKFFPERIQKSPFWCENAFEYSAGTHQILKMIGQTRANTAGIPLWYPLAFRFRRAQP